MGSQVASDAVSSDWSVGPRRRSWVVLVLVSVLALAACGGDDSVGGGEEAPSPSTTQPGVDDATTTIAPSTTTTSTTTTTTTTSTTLPPTPEDVFVAAVDDAGLRPDGASDEDLLGIASGLCGEASGYSPDPVRPFELSLSVGVYTGSLFGGSPERPTAEAARMTALAFETICPENVPLLGASSQEWASVLGRDSTEAGVCYRQASDFSSHLLVVACAEPHHGEIVALLDASEDTQWPSTGGRDQAGLLDVAEQCRSAYLEYYGAPADANVGLLGISQRLLAANESEWDAGERGIVCSAAASKPILRGSVAGTYEAVLAASEVLEFDVTTCTPEQFEATLANPSDIGLALHFEFRSYFPTGAVHEVTTDIGPGETLEIMEDFDDPFEDSPTDCDRWSLDIAQLP